MKRLLPFDPVMLSCVLIMLAASLLMVASSSMSISAVRYGDAYRIIGHWAVYVPIGLALMWAVSRIEADWWRAMIMPLLGIVLVLMVLVLIPGIGMEINGARRWYSLLGLTLQPVELLKPVLVIYMAYYMAAFPDRMKTFSTGLAPMLVVLGIAVLLLLLQPDFGSSALLVALCISMWFVGGVPLRHLTLMVGSVLPAGVVIMLAEPYRVKRFMSFVDPWADPLGSGYQLLQSMVAFGVGGVHGAGLGQGVQKLFYLPEPFTDFISAVIGEELGMPGMFALILLFGLLLMRGMQVARRVQDSFQRLLVVGCVTLLATTFFINLGAAMGVMPTKGMPMPLMSYGGSALFGTCILLGLIFSVQRHEAKNKPREAGNRQGEIKHVRRGVKV